MAGSIVASNPSVGPNGDPAPSESTQIGFEDGSGNLTNISAANPLPVSASFSPSGTQDVNLIQVAGVAVTLGQKAMAASIPVVLSSNQASIPVAATLSAETTKVIGTVNQGTSPWVVSLTSTTITGTVAVTQSTSPWIVAGGGTAGSAATGVVTIQGIASMTPVQVSQATGTNLHMVVDSGTVTTVSTVTTITNAVTVIGSIADDSPTPGNPVTVGGLAKSPDGTDPGSVSAENDVARFITDLNRRVYVNDAHPRSLNFHSNGSSALTDTSVAADPGDGFQIVVTSIIFSTGAATACNIFFEEGASTVMGPWYLEAVAGRGVFWQGYKFITASTALTVTTSASIAQSLDVGYYIQAV